MKKIALIAAMAVFAFTANAQKNALMNTGLTDNLSISLQGGVYEPMYGGDFIKDMRPVVRLAVNKYFNPVVGVSLYGEAFINNNNGNYRVHQTSIPGSTEPYYYTTGADVSCFPNVTNAYMYDDYREQGCKTAIDFSNVGVNALINLSNLFGGYKGQPRKFEFAAEAGLGWAHVYGHAYNARTLEATTGKVKYVNGDDVNSFVTTNLALDLNINLAKKWQINVRPALQYQGRSTNFDRRLYGAAKEVYYDETENEDRQTGEFWRLDMRRAIMQLTAGVTYKIGEDFAFCDKLYSQADLDAANAGVNDLRNQLDAANREIGRLKTELANKKPIINNTVVQGKLAPVVIFEKAKYVIGRAQQPSVQMIATYLKNHPDSKVLVKGYASPEGNKEYNQKLSENRAKAVRDMLVNTYKINSNRIRTEGLGATSEIFPENDWNRVVTFIEE